MKLKPVVASLIVLGLVSPAFAAKKTVVTQEAVKDTSVLQMILDQNSVVSPVSSDNWFNRISIGGMGTLQAIYNSDNPPNGAMTNSDSSSTDFYVNNLNLLINADLNCWSKATVNLLYYGVPYYETLPAQNIAGTLLRTQSHTIRADEAYVTFANLAKSPFYAKVGKQYVPFGDYVDPYNIVLTPMAQNLEESDQTAVNLGVITDFGPYASVYGFEGKTAPVGADSYNIRNFGARIGWADSLTKIGYSGAHFNVNLDWIRAIQDGDFWTEYYGSGHDPISGLAGHIDLSYEQVAVNFNYMTALKNVVAGDDNTEIHAGDIGADYSFKTFSQDSKVGLSYQWSANAINVFTQSYLQNWFPKNRVQADYKVNLMKNVDAALVYAHNKSYSFDGSAPVSNVGLAKLMVQF